MFVLKIVTEQICYLLLNRRKLKQDMLGKSPLDMTQYTKVFNGCRIPGTKKDSTRHAMGSKHIIVVYNNHVS